MIGAAIEVHRHFGPGLLESAYEACLTHELACAGLHAALKSVEQMDRVHESRMLSDLKLSGLKLGLLINFNVPRLATGIRRFANERPHKISARSVVDPKPKPYSTVTDLARLRGWSTSVPRWSAT